MYNNPLILGVSLLCLLSSSLTYAGSSDNANRYLAAVQQKQFDNSSQANINKEILLAPKCFLENNGLEYKELAVKKDFVLFELSTEYLIAQSANIKHIKDCGKFTNVSSDWQDYTAKKSLQVNSVAPAEYQNFLDNYLLKINNLKTSKAQFNVPETDNNQIVKDLIGQVDDARLMATLKVLTSYDNRGAATNDGLKAAAKIKAWVEDIARQNNKTANEFSTEYVYNKSNYYKQPSVVAVYGKNLPGAAVIIGAHMDTLSRNRMPGADDNASGSSVILEAAKVIMGSKYSFNRPIYFIWYSAEEVGLVGSKHVVPYFKNKKTKIDSVLNLDMVGTRNKPNDPAMYFLDDNVNMQFTNYLADLAKNHLSLPIEYTRCGYGCSDHASWNDAGYIAAGGFESSFDDMNQYIHTSQDTLTYVNIDWVKRFAQLAVAYIGDKAGQAAVEDNPQQ